MNDDACAAIADYLRTAKSLSVSLPWLRTFLQTAPSATRAVSGRPPNPTVLGQSAFFKLLLSDITASLEPDVSGGNIFPEDVSHPAVPERFIRGPVVVQVLDAEDVGSSAFSQIEAMDRVEEGRRMGREVVRTVNRDEGGDVNVNGVSSSNSSSSNNNNNYRINGTMANGNSNANTANFDGRNSNTKSGPFRFTLQDAQGTRLYGFEFRPLEGLSSLEKIRIGMKIVLKNVTIARGMALLEPSCVTVLGGRIEDLDNAWRAARRDTLLRKLNEQT